MTMHPGTEDGLTRSRASTSSLQSPPGAGPEAEQRQHLSPRSPDCERIPEVKPDGAIRNRVHRRPNVRPPGWPREAACCVGLTITRWSSKAIHGPLSSAQVRSILLGAPLLVVTSVENQWSPGFQRSPCRLPHPNLPLPSTPHLIGGFGLSPVVWVPPLRRHSHKGRTLWSKWAENSLYWS